MSEVVRDMFGSDVFSDPLTPDTIERICDKIRRWSNIMLNGAEPPAELRQELRDVTTTMDRWSWSWSSAWAN